LITRGIDLEGYTLSEGVSLGSPQVDIDHFFALQLLDGYIPT
jgi:hypothetical protein